MRHKNIKTGTVYSKPTMCLWCHLVVEMFYDRDTDPVKGAWQCPTCGHLYPFRNWKIKKEPNPKKRKNEDENPPSKKISDLLRQAFERYKERLA